MLLLGCAASSVLRFVYFRAVLRKSPSVVQEMKNADKSDIECGHFTSDYRS